MKSKHLIVVSFVLMVAVQLYFPASMIWSKEKVIKEGVAYKFEVAPVDPNDPFRGKYIVIDVAEDAVANSEGMKWNDGEAAYASIGINERGFAYPTAISRQRPESEVNYIKVEVAYASPDMIYIDYPFDRFYMEEDKAFQAEMIYNESLRDTNSVTYALVMVNKGAAVLQNVFVNDTAIVDLVNQQEVVEPLKLD